MECENAGAFAVSIECLPHSVAGIITETLNIPVIGIGAGLHCDGQACHPGYDWTLLSTLSRNCKEM